MNHTAVEILSGRHNPGIDPTFHVWGVEIPIYLFLGGLVAGLMVLLAALELTYKEQPEGRLRLGPLLGLGLLSLGMGSLFLDLSYKLHVFRFYTAFRPTSPMSWGSWLLLLVYPALILLGIGALNETWRARVKGTFGDGFIGVAWRLLQRLADRKRSWILWLNLVLGLGLGAYTGILLGTLSARPLWNTPLLGPLFLVSGISTGAALLLLLRPPKAQAHILVRWDLAAILLELSLLGLFLIGGVSSDASAAASISLLLGGAWTPWFWSLVVALGLAVPALLEGAELRFGLTTTAWSPVLVLIGGFALRAILVGAGQDSSVDLFLNTLH